MDINNYLKEIYILEDIKYISEDFSLFAKSANIQKIKDRFKKAIDSKDSQALINLASIVPKIYPEKLYKIGVKAHPNFEKAYKYAGQEIKKQLAISDSKIKDNMTIMVAALAAVGDDPKNKAMKIVSAIKTKMMGKQKKFGLFGGTLALLTAGAFIAAAIASLTLWPLLLAIVIISFSVLVVAQGGMV